MDLRLLNSRLPHVQHLTQRKSRVSPTRRKREIYDRYVKLQQEYQETADKLPASRRDDYLKINRRCIQVELKQKYTLTQPEMQWIINNGTGIEPTNSNVQRASRGKKPTPNEEKRQLALDETRKAIFKDWAARRRARLETRQDIESVQGPSLHEVGR